MGSGRVTPARVFTLTLHKSGQQQLVTARTCGELKDVVMAHYPGALGESLAANAWNSDSILLQLGITGPIKEVNK